MFMGVDPSALPLHSRKRVVPWGLDTLCDPRSQLSPGAGRRSWKFPAGSWRRAAGGAHLVLCPAPLKQLHPLTDPPAFSLVSHVPWLWQEEKTPYFYQLCHHPLGFHE